MAAVAHIRGGKCGVRLVPLHQGGIIRIEFTIHIKDI
jgi:hypothetical protein